MKRELVKKQSLVFTIFLLISISVFYLNINLVIAGTGDPCFGTGLTNCAGTCIDINTDANNCGGCGISCSADSECVNGQCSGGCVPSNNDGDNYDTCNGDCDDNNADINPTAIEICDNIDNNCDGNIDEGNVCACIPNCDGKSCSDDNGCGTSCGCPDGQSCNWNGMEYICESSCVPSNNDGDNYDTCNGDCDDNNADIYPGATENCDDNIDNNCDGQVNEGCGGCDNNDYDADGYSACTGDCDEQNMNVNPGVGETCSDSIDNNCNGQVDEDCATLCNEDLECNDNDPCTINTCQKPWWCPGCQGNCISEPNPACNCYDHDEDGYQSSECGGDDCNDGDSAINPGQSETCDDNADNDCDGNTDCADSECAGDFNCLVGNENCANGVDDDGDGLIDCEDEDCDSNSNCMGNICGCSEDMTCIYGDYSPSPQCLEDVSVESLVEQYISDNGLSSTITGEVIAQSTEITPLWKIVNDLCGKIRQEKGPRSREYIKCTTTVKFAYYKLQCKLRSKECGEFELMGDTLRCGSCDETKNEECNDKNKCVKKCPPEQKINPSTGACCTPDCSEVACGDENECGEICECTCSNENPECYSDDDCGSSFRCDNGCCVCEGNCNGKVCGYDDCGISCGDCDPGYVCEDGSCVVQTCSGTCDDGDDCTTDSCDTNTGDCSHELITCDDGDDCTADSCSSGYCSNNPIPGCCVADCTDKFCGNDGCGGSCGDCPDEQTCNSNGQCEDICNSNPILAVLTLGFYGTCPSCGDRICDWTTEDCSCSDCENDPSCIVQTEDCTNGVDDDSDELIDCADSDCVNAANCIPVIETICDDEIDNDGDRYADCADSDCVNDLNCIILTESDCANLIDDDGDGLVDCEDEDCRYNHSCVVLCNNDGFCSVGEESCPQDCVAKIFYCDVNGMNCREVA